MMSTDARDDANVARRGVAAVVLAAGSSARLGRNKLLLPLHGETVVRRAARAALESGVDRVVVVLGHEAAAVAAELAGLACEQVRNPDHAQGATTSLHLGVRQAARAGQAAVIVLADMPFVTGAMIQAVVERYRASGAPLVVSQYGEVRAPPILFAPVMFDELLADSSEGCARRLVGRHAHEATVVEWPADALQDVDVAEDYARARARLAGG
jgi:molybdenum cofactor cytidylyltransferase